MHGRHSHIIVLLCGVVFGLACSVASAADKEGAEPTKVYVPYEKLKGVFEKEQQGVPLF